MLSSLALALAAATGPVTLTAVVERLALVPSARGRPPSVEADPLVGRVLVRGARLEPRAHSQLCPRQEATDEGTLLRCTSRRMWAQVDVGERPVLELRELRGVLAASPVQDIPRRAWPLAASGLPGECPGSTPVARAECLLAEGRREEALPLYLEALESADARLAHLRLGDAALLTLEVDAAVQHYAKAQGSGPLGRLARARRCVLVGDCLGEGPIDTRGLHESQVQELELDSLRRLVASEQVALAMAVLVERTDANPALCTGAEGLCQKLLQAGLESPSEEAQLLALSLSFVESARLGPYRLELSLAAAEVAQRTGAPGFAATLLSSVTPLVSPARLPAHLERTARLYTQAGDTTRAGFVRDYAVQTLGRKARKGPAPVAEVSRPQAALQALPEVDPDVALARGALARARARALRLGGVAPAGTAGGPP